MYLKVPVGWGVVTLTMAGTEWKLQAAVAHLFPINDALTLQILAASAGKCVHLLATEGPQETDL